MENFGVSFCSLLGKVGLRPAGKTMHFDNCRAKNIFTFAVACALAVLHAAEVDGMARSASIASPDGEVLAVFKEEGSYEIGSLQFTAGGFSVNGERGTSPQQAARTRLKTTKLPVVSGTFGLDIGNAAAKEKAAASPNAVHARIPQTAPTYTHSPDAPWHNPFGERATVHNAYNGAILDMGRYSVEVRVYNHVVAFRYIVNEIKSPASIDDGASNFAATILADKTTFRFGEASKIYTAGGTEGPVAVKSAGGNVWCAIATAGADEWCATDFCRSKDNPNTIESRYSSAVDALLPAATPWKVVAVANDAIGLLAMADTILDLNAPCKVADAERWIKPGKVFRAGQEDGISRRRAIDFAARHKIEYVLFPIGGDEFAASRLWQEDGSPHDEGTAGICMYARECGVGVWLEFDAKNFRKHGFGLFKTFARLGVKGVRVCNMPYRSDRWRARRNDLVREAAQEHIMVSFEGASMPDGFSRTYPNLMTMDIAGTGELETNNARQNTVYAFTRMLCGSANSCAGYYERHAKASHAHRLAAGLVFFSPLKDVMWGDRPSDAIEGNPELDWFDNLPAVFDDTIYISGAPEDHVAVARRKGDEWFVAAIAGDVGASVRFNFAFLEPGRSYTATLYRDDSHGTSFTAVGKIRKRVDSRCIWNFDLKDNGGIAIKITPDGR
ncbi:MAG: glycoside hydrolase family 97 catalytic domain-containing protein [Kiritimatiellae bacterium]|nr:glycoside hydrolase family 97 catalytic domain-containing protein [Kiritimatiellia bacterium]